MHNSAEKAEPEILEQVRFMLLHCIKCNSAVSSLGKPGVYSVHQKHFSGRNCL